MLQISKMKRNTKLYLSLSIYNDQKIRERKINDYECSSSSSFLIFPISKSFFFGSDIHFHELNIPLKITDTHVSIP